MMNTLLSPQRNPRGTSEESVGRTAENIYGRIPVEISEKIT